jgi:hypothetical protein
LIFVELRHSFRVCTIRFNTSTLQRFNASTLQRFNTSTVQHFNSSLATSWLRQRTNANPQLAIANPDFRWPVRLGPRHQVGAYVKEPPGLRKPESGIGNTDVPHYCPQ